MKRKLALGIAVTAICAAIGLMLYPLISNAYQEKHQSEICILHKEEMEKLPDQKISEQREKAQAYNETLQPIPQNGYTAEMLDEAAQGYAAQLDLTADGIMGYVEIPKIQVYLPIYHGTHESTLEAGVGHLLGSSLPVGGEGTHAVLTAHSGMASQKLFSDLPQMKKGDVFYLHVLNEVLAYQVDSIQTVLPYETSQLSIFSKEDLCTLVTCTPFGVNSHRLLVRGRRIPYEPAPSEATVPEHEPIAEGSNWEQAYFNGILWSTAGLLCMTAVGTACYFWRKHHEKI